MIVVFLNVKGREMFLVPPPSYVGGRKFDTDSAVQDFRRLNVLNTNRAGSEMNMTSLPKRTDDRDWKC